MSDKMKHMVSALTLPRFIWVAELSERNKLKRGVVSGIILLDATESKTEFHNALLVSFCEGKVLYKEEHSLKMANITMNDFAMYNNNLK